MTEVTMHWLSNFLKKAGWLHILAHILCISFFSVQMYRLVEQLVSPTMTYTYVREVPLKDIDFPLDIKVCVTPSLNITALNEFGYDGTLGYISGLSNRSNYPSVGWGGHDNHGRNLSSAREVLNRATLNTTKDILEEAWIVNHNDDKIKTKISEANLVKINPLNNCQILKLNQENMKGMKNIDIHFNEKSQNSSVEIKLLGQGLTTHREILKHRFYSFGDEMKFKNRLTGYIVKIKENVFVEEDPSQTCRNYPTSEFSSYTECDDHYVRKRLDQIAPGLNLTPVWMADDLDLVTTQPLPIKGSVLGKELINDKLSLEKIVVNV